MEGEVDGEVEILFSDGGYYKGLMCNGRIEGRGSYHSAFNELYEGCIVNGALHGHNGSYKNHADDVLQGSWCRGRLQGEGVYRNDRGDYYKGHWKDGLRHGRGVAKYSHRALYKGYFLNDGFFGKGELHFGLKQSPASGDQEPYMQQSDQNIEQCDDRKMKINMRSEFKISGTISDLHSQSNNLDINTNGDKNISKKQVDDVDERFIDSLIAKELEKFSKHFSGYFAANRVCNGGVLFSTGVWSGVVWRHVM